MEDFEDNKYEQPDQADRDLTTYVLDHIERWRDYRDTNYLEDWLEYERIFRCQWAAEDVTRSSERSRIISPATQQAVETRHAEIMEAIFGNGEFFDIKDDLKDQQTMDIAELRVQLKEDLETDKIRKSIDQIELLAEIYGTGIGEIIVAKEKTFVPATQQIPGVEGAAAIGVMEGERTSVKLMPVNPKNFLIDPNATGIEDALGVAVEKYVSLHQVVKGIEDGIYRKVEVGTEAVDDDLEPTQDMTNFQDGKVRLLTYYGLVPRKFIEKFEEQENGAEFEELFPQGSSASEYEDLVEGIVVIANQGILLKAEINPYMMKDRPIVAYQDDTVPNRFWGRGTVEKAYNMQKAIDAQLRAHLDSLALTTAPMIAMDATRLPRGAKFEVRPGKAILTNGNPNEILQPFKFGNVDPAMLSTSKEFERMLLQATGTLDSSGMPTNAPRDASGSGMSMAMAGIIKKYKRTLTNFQEDFLVPFIKKAAYRFMQFDSERYPSQDFKFIPAATLGIMAREYEQSQFIALLQTLGHETPVLPLILKGIIANSSLSNKAELEQALTQMAQPNPEQQQIQQQAAQMQMEQAQAQTQALQARAAKDAADAQKTQIEAQLLPEEIQAKIIGSLSTNIRGEDSDREFERRAKIAELMIKEADIANRKNIVELQMKSQEKA
jgi:hypothetical protein